MANKRTTIVDVAERAGVSKATVSAVINDKETVKDSTRQDVLTAINELNYRPSASARRQFRSDTRRSIGVIIKEADNPYYAEVIEGIRAHTSEKEYSLLTASSEGSYDAEKRIVELFTAQEVDGLIITPVLDDQADLSHIFDLKRRNVPFVLLEEVRGIQANLVDIDNVAASRKAAKHLMDGGHKRIVHFAGPRYSMHSEERVQGVRQAYSESHLVFSNQLIIEAGARLQDGYQTGLDYFEDLNAKERPTAVTCYNDLVAVGLLRALRELGLRVPEDISVIGCDDLEITKYVSPPLTSIRSPKEEMGQYAADLLLRQMESPRKASLEKEYLHADLVIRGSTAPLSS